MSIDQLASRAGRFLRDQFADGAASDAGDPLRTAEALIDEVRQKEDREWQAALDAGSSIMPSTIMTYERALTLLVIGPDATLEEVSAAYRKVIRKHHPDTLRNSSSGEQETGSIRTRELNEAYALVKARFTA